MSEDEMERLVDDAPELALPPSRAEVERLLDWMVKRGLLTRRLDLYGEYVYRVSELGEKWHNHLRKWLGQPEEA